MTDRQSRKTITHDLHLLADLLTAGTVKSLFFVALLDGNGASLHAVTLPGPSVDALINAIEEELGRLRILARMTRQP